MLVWYWMPSLLCIDISSESELTMPSLVTISPTVVAIAFVEHPLIQDSLNSMGNFHTLVGLRVGFAFVKIVVNSCYAVVVPEPVPATDAEQLKRVFSLVSVWTAQRTAHIGKIPNKRMYALCYTRRPTYLCHKSS